MKNETDPNLKNNIGGRATSADTGLTHGVFIAGLILKFCVIISAIAGIYLQMTADGQGFMGSSMALFRYYTIQSNIWIAAICAVFFSIDMASNGSRRIGNFFYIIKFMFTVAITLTFFAFTVLLSPMMPKSYLKSPSNICLHTLAPLLAIADFILCDYGFKSNIKYSLYGAIMPFIYMIYSFILSFAGIKFGNEIVPYFFLNYKKLGWFTVNANGVGVVYWIIVMIFFILLIGILLLVIKDWRYRRMTLRSEPAGK